MRRRALLAAAGLAAGLAAAELLLAWLRPQPYPGYEVYDPSGERLYDPDYHIGRAPRDAPALKPWLSSSPFTLVVVGDSFTGHFLGPDLAKALGRPCGRPALSVVPGGMAAIGTGEELALYKCHWKQRRPHLVLLQFYIGDDVQNNRRFADFRAQRRFWQRSELWRLCRRWKDGLWVRVSEPAETSYRQALADEVDLFRKRPLRAHDWPRTFQYLSDFKRAVRNRGGTLAVVIVPRDLQVEPKTIAPLLPAGLRLEDLDLSKPDRELARFLKQQGVPALDLLGPLRAEAPAGPLYDHAHFDIHWNRRGEDAANEAILRWLPTLAGPRAPLDEARADCVASGGA